MDIFNWDIFLNLVNKNKIIPVIGSDLLLVEKNKKTIPLYSYFTQKLGEKLKVDPENLNFREFVLENKSIDFFDDVREEVFEELLKEDILILDHIHKLARITGFSFYISTTFDNILESILSKERCKPNQKINSIHYSYPSLALKIQEQQGESGPVPTVYKILGSFDSKTCAITDEEILEYIFSLNRENSTSDILYNEILGKKLLFLGCAFPNWLLRFFIRILTNEPFDASKTEKIIADNYVHKDAKLSSFLKHFRTQILSLSEKEYNNPIKFINDLYEKWIIFKKDTIPKKYEGTVFLSYSHHDKDLIITVQNEMLANGINVWIDENKLKSGDNYRQIIIEKIKECNVFIAFISEASITDTESYVYSVEWDQAIARRKTRENEYNTDSFIHPIILDDTDVTDERIPAIFRKLTIQKLSTDSLIELVKQKLNLITHE